MDEIRWAISMSGYKPIDVHREETKVVWNGNFSLPRPREFATKEEAAAFLDGICWAVRYFGGSITIRGI